MESMQYLYVYFVYHCHPGIFWISMKLLLVCVLFNATFVVHYIDYNMDNYYGFCLFITA